MSVCVCFSDATSIFISRTRGLVSSMCAVKTNLDVTFWPVFIFKIRFHLICQWLWLNSVCPHFVLYTSVCITHRDRHGRVFFAQLCARMRLLHKLDESVKWPSIFRPNTDNLTKKFHPSLCVLKVSLARSPSLSLNRIKQEFQIIQMMKNTLN